MYTIIDDEGNTMMVEDPAVEYIYTYTDYLTWKFAERLELFRGKIYKMPGANTKHQLVSGKIFFRMAAYFDHKKCKIFRPSYDIRLPVKNKKKDAKITTVVQPDLCVVCDESKIDARGIIGAPDLVVEILSPGNSQKEVRLKFELYEEAGVKECRIVNTVEETLVIYVLNYEGKFAGGKMYAGGDALPSQAIKGLILEVTDIFNN